MQIALFDWATIGVQSYRYYLRCGLGLSMAIYGLGRVISSLPTEDFIPIGGLQFSLGILMLGLTEIVIGISLTFYKRYQRTVYVLYGASILWLFPSNVSLDLERWILSPKPVSSHNFVISIEHVMVVQVLIVIALVFTASLAKNVSQVTYISPVKNVSHVL